MTASQHTPATKESAVPALDAMGVSPRAPSAHTLAGNSVALMAARVGTQLGMALFTVLLARQLGASVFGQYAFIAAVLVVGNVVSTWGTDMLLIREIAAEDDWSLVAPALVLQLGFSALFVLLVMFAAPQIPSIGTPAALKIYSLSLFPLAFFTVFTAALRGQQRMLEYAALNVGLILLQLLAVAALIVLRGGLIELAGLLLTVQVLAALLAGWILRSGLHPQRLSIRWAARALPRLVKLSAPIGVVALFGITYQRAAYLLLPALAGSVQAGQYAAAGRLIEAAKMGHVAVFTALFPLMAQAAGCAGPDQPRRFRIPWRFLLAGAALAAAFLAVLAAPIVRILYGAEYLKAIPVLRVLAWVLIPYTVNSVLTLSFLARRETSAIVVALGLSLTTSLVLLAWWVPGHGAVGAAWAMLAGELLQSIMLMGLDLRAGGLVASVARLRGLA